MADNSFSNSNISDPWMNSESMTSYDSDDEEGVLQQNFEAMEITGITDVLPRLASVQSDDSWAVESYANDSLPLAHWRIEHSQLGYNQEEDDLSLGYGSASGGVQQQQPTPTPAKKWVMDEDDWTIQSDCNDSVGLANTRLKHHEPEPTPAPVVAVEVKAVSPLVRIPRRRASMGDFVEKEQQQLSPQVLQVQPPAPSQQQQRRISNMRRKSLSSVESLSTVEESLSSGRSGNSSNSNPASSSSPTKKKTSKSGRTAISRTKSMPYVKPASLGNVVPLWPDGQSELPRRKMDRRVSNGGTPCAA